MRLCCGPKPHVLHVNMPTQVEMCLVTEEKKEQNVQETWVVFDLFADTLAKFIALILAGLALGLKNLHFVSGRYE